MTQDLYYYESGYLTPDTGYYTYVADAEAAISSSSTISVEANKIKNVNAVLATNFSQSSLVSAIKNASIALSSSFTQTTYANRTEGFDLYSFSNAALSAQAKRLRDNNIIASSQFNIAIDGARIRYVSAEEDSAFVISVDNLRVRYDEAALDAAFSLTAEIKKTQYGTSDLTATTSQTTINDKIRFFESALSSAFVVDCESVRIPGGIVVEASGSWTSSATVSAVISHIHGIDLNAFSNAALDTTALRIQSSSVNLNTEFTSSVDPVKTADTASNLTSQSQFSSTEIRVRNFDIQLSSASTQSSIIGKIIQFTAAEYSAFTPTVVCTPLRNSFAVLNATASLTAQLDTARLFTSTMTSQATVSVSALKLKIASATLSSTSQLSVPYASFKNKRPGSLYRNYSTPTPLGVSDYSTYLSNTVYKYGTGSLVVPYSTTNPTIYSYVPTNTDYIFNSNENFYISFYHRLTSWDNALSTTHSIFSIGTPNTSNSLEIKYFTNASGLSYYSAEFNNLVMSAANYGYVASNTWIQMIIKRQSGVVTFQTVGAGSTESLLTVSSTAVITGQMYFYGPGKTGATSYFDEVYVGQSVSTAPNTYNGQIIDGGLPTTVALYHFNGDFQDDLTTIYQVNAVLSSTATITAQPDNRTKSATANLQANGFTATAVGRIRPQVAALSSNFSITINGGLLKRSSVALSSTATVNANAIKPTLFNAALQSAFSLTTNALDLDLAVISLSSSASLSVTPTYNQAKTYGSVISIMNFETTADLVDPNRTNTIGGSRLTTYGNPDWDTSFGKQLVDGFPYVQYTDPVILNNLVPGGTTPWSIDFKARTVNPNTLIGSFAPYSPSPIFTLKGKKADGSTVYAKIGIYDFAVNSGINLSYTYWYSTTGFLDGGTTQSANNPTIARYAVSDTEFADNPPRLLQLRYFGNGTYRFLVDGTTIFDINSNDSSANPVNFPNQLVSIDSLYVGIGATGVLSNAWTIDEVRIQAGTYQATSLLPYSATSGTNEYSLNNQFVSTASLSITPRKVIIGSAALSSAFAQSTVPLRIKKYTAAITARATVSAGPTKAIIIASAQTSTFTVSSLLSRTERTTAALTSTATVTANATKVIVNTSAITSQFSQSTSAKRLRGITLNATSQFTQTSSAIRTLRTGSNLTAFAAEISVVNRIGRGLVHFDARATLQVNARVTTGSFITLSSNSQLTAAPISLVITTAQITSNASLTLVPTYLRRNESIMLVTASMATNNSRTRRLASQQTAAFSLTANNGRLRGFAQATTARFTFVTNNQILRLAQANLLSDTTMPPIIAGIMVRYEADLVCEGFQLTAGRVVHIDEFYQLKIESETRYLVIVPETRLLGVEQETRVNKIIGR